MTFPFTRTGPRLLATPPRGSNKARWPAEKIGEPRRSRDHHASRTPSAARRKLPSPVPLNYKISSAAAGQCDRRRDKSSRDDWSAIRRVATLGPLSFRPLLCAGPERAS
ncbi:hypothetical protein MRX96_012369 [Rhipicephalus microplus]